MISSVSVWFSRKIWVVMKLKHWKFWNDFIYLTTQCEDRNYTITFKSRLKYTDKVHANDTNLLFDDQNFQYITSWLSLWLAQNMFTLKTSTDRLHCMMKHFERSLNWNIVGLYHNNRMPFGLWNVPLRRLFLVTRFAILNPLFGDQNFQYINSGFPETPCSSIIIIITIPRE